MQVLTKKAWMAVVPRSEMLSCAFMKAFSGTHLKPVVLNSCHKMHVAYVHKERENPFYRMWIYIHIVYPYLYCISLYNIGEEKVLY